MKAEGKGEGMLSPYCVLDLTDEKGLLCGKLLGDLGADVIKIEKPGGDPARFIGPFYHDETDPEKSLFWFSYNTNKRGITLDLESVEGRETFRKLARTAAFVVESFPPGYLDKLGLGYSDLEKLNPEIIMVSITPFGQKGPHKGFKGPDIVTWAMCGQMASIGDPDRPPIRVSHHAQSHLQGAAAGAFGAVMALYHRQETGEGQHVDVSIQASATQLIGTFIWDIMKISLPRGFSLGIKPPHMWPCADGYVLWFLFDRDVARRMNEPLIKWMESEGSADPYLAEFDWNTFDLKKTTQEIVDRLCAPIWGFFAKRTKAELLTGAVKHRLILYPVSTVSDIMQSAQLDARNFWVRLEHPELGASLVYPGPFAKGGELSPRITRRAPLIGEHNDEIFRELQISSPKKAVQTNRRKNKGLSAKPMAGIRIADFTSYAAAPMATKYFADYGAEVIKVEGKSRPDQWRTFAPFKDNIPGVNRSGSFNQINTGKRSIALNLKHPKGVETARRIAACSDIVIENFAGGVMNRMGLGYDEIRKIRPDIIMISTCMQGQTGPHASHPGFGPHLTALSGFCHISGWPDRAPVEIGTYTDLISPYFVGLTALAALDYRRRTGKGQYFDLSQYEIALQYLAPLILDYTVNGRVANRMGNALAYAAPHAAYRCRKENNFDRWCTIAVFTEEEWKRFGEVIGRSPWIYDPKFATLQGRKENEEELNRLVEEWTINYSPEEVMNKMQSAGVPAGVVETGRDQLEIDPQLKHRHAFWELDHPEIGRYRAPAPPFLLMKTGCELRRAPLLGEDNQYVLKEILGMSDDEISELLRKGAIE